MKKPKQANNLFSEFSPVSLEEWEKLIRKDLNGADYKSVLKWNTLEGVSPLPFYVEQNSPSSITNNNGLKFLQNRIKSVPVYGPGISDANKSITEAIKNGADCSILKIRISGRDLTIGGNLAGIQVHNQENFDSLFDKVDLKNHELIFDSGMASPALISMLLNHTNHFKAASFLFDPFTYKAAHGRNPLPEDELITLIHQIIGIKNIRALSADGLFYHHSGATIAQELGTVIALGSEYLAHIEESKRTEAMKTFFVRLSAGPLYFPEIAKFRAIRVLWANLLEAYNIDTDLPLFIHAQTSPQNKPITDSHNNMLRSTTEAMAAIMGGADSICVMPYDSQFRKPDKFSNRIARNIQHIISEEAHLNKVSDPSAGSYYIENLTEEIAHSAWNFFKLIEEQGGFLKSIEAGFFQNEINKSKESKLEAYATRKRILTGTNQYPNTEEVLPDIETGPEYITALLYNKDGLSIEPDNLIPSLRKHFKNGATLGDVTNVLLNPQKVLYTALEPFNAGQIFDHIRKQTLNWAEKSGRKPRVSLIPLGDQKWRKARASFAANLLGCAGFIIDNPNGFESVEKAKKETGPSDIYVLCSSDKEYDALVKPFCKAFKESGILILAGKPGANKDRFSKLGIDHFIMKGTDLPKLLTAIQDQIFANEVKI